MVGVFELICGLDLSLQNNSSWMDMFISGEGSLRLESMWVQGETENSLFPEFVCVRPSSEEGSEVDSWCSALKVLEQMDLLICAKVDCNQMC